MAYGEICFQDVLLHCPRKLMLSFWSQNASFFLFISVIFYDGDFA